MSAFLLTSFEAADRLRMLHSRVLRLARYREIPFVALPDGELRFDARELDEWIQLHKRPQVPSEDITDGD